MFRSVNRMGFFTFVALCAFSAEAIFARQMGFAGKTIFWAILAQLIITATVLAAIDPLRGKGAGYGFAAMCSFGSLILMAAHELWWVGFAFFVAGPATMWIVYGIRRMRYRIYFR